MWEDDENTSQEEETPEIKRSEKPKEERKLVSELAVRYYEVDLPSNGKLGYPETIKYRDVLVRDEKILATATRQNYDRVLNDVLKNLLEEPGQYENLAVSDRDFLMLWIWANSYSSYKTFDVTCPECQAENEVKVDLTEVNVDELPDDYEEPFPLDISGDRTIALRQMTVGDERRAMEFVKKNKEYEPAYVMLVQAIDVGAEMPLKSKVDFVENNLTGRDMAYVRGFHNHFRFGVDSRVDHECSACSEVTRYEIPFSVEFFMPTLSDNFEKNVRSGKNSKDKSD